MMTMFHMNSLCTVPLWHHSEDYESKELTMTYTCLLLPRVVFVFTAVLHSVERIPVELQAQGEEGRVHLPSHEVGILLTGNQRA